MLSLWAALPWGHPPGCQVHSKDRSKLATGFLKIILCSFTNSCIPPFSKCILGSYCVTGSGLWDHKEDVWTWRGYTLMGEGHLHSPDAAWSHKVLWKKHYVCWGWKQQGRLHKGSDIWAASWQLRSLAGNQDVCVTGRAGGWAGFRQSACKPKSESVALFMVSPRGMDLAHHPAGLSRCHKLARQVLSTLGKGQVSLLTLHRFCLPNRTWSRVRNGDAEDM